MIPKKTNYSLHLILKNLKYLHFLQKNQIQNFIGTQGSIDPFLKIPELQSSYNLAKRLYSSNKITGLNRNQLQLSLPLNPTHPPMVAKAKPNRADKAKGWANILDQPFTAELSGTPDQRGVSAKVSKTINANLSQKTFFYYSPSFFQSIYPLHYFPSAQVTSSVLERNPYLELRAQSLRLRSPLLPSVAEGKAPNPMGG